MADKKVISIRFYNGSNEDTELYEKLEQEAMNGGSLARVAKARIKSSYEYEEKNNTHSDLREQIVEIIQDEMQKSSMKIVGAILSGVNGGVSTENVAEIQEESGNQLPEKTTDLPNVALDFLR